VLSRARAPQAPVPLPCTNPLLGDTENELSWKTLTEIGTYNGGMSLACAAFRLAKVCDLHSI
jgi:hypothetical protein